MSCVRSQTPRRHLGCTEVSKDGFPLEGAASKEAFHSWTSSTCNVRIPLSLRDEGSSHQGSSHSLTSESGVEKQRLPKDNSPRTLLELRCGAEGPCTQAIRWAEDIWNSHHNRGSSRRRGETEVPVEKYLHERMVITLEKEMATHSSTLSWKIPWTEEPGRLQSMGSQRIGHDWVTLLSLFMRKQMAAHTRILAWRIS